MKVGILLFQASKKIIVYGQGIQVNDQYPDWFFFQVLGQILQGMQLGDRDVGLLQHGREFSAMLDISINYSHPKHFHA
jgi:hypothetical protein